MKLLKAHTCDCSEATKTKMNILNTSAKNSFQKLNVGFKKDNKIYTQKTKMVNNIFIGYFTC